jgi:1,2-diacylglycerol-3-alpha-glucose alpha-1,2-glucosyltransferase
VNVYKAKNLSQFCTKTVDLLSGKLPHLEEEGRKVALEKSLDNVGRKLTNIYKEAFHLEHL